MPATPHNGSRAQLRGPESGSARKPGQSSLDSERLFPGVAGGDEVAIGATGTVPAT